MGINMIEKNGEQIIDYKFRENTDENNNINLGNSLDDYEVLHTLGKGGYSQVLKVKSKKNSKVYAMKKINWRNILDDKGCPKFYENEIYYLQKLNHPNIIKCYNIFRIGDFLYIILEYMNNGDLYNYYSANISLNIRFSEEQIWLIIYNCLMGLDYIHRQGLIHRDIKLENLFIDDNLNIKIADFNVSATIDQKSAQNFVPDMEKAQYMINFNTNTGVGSLGYKAPEFKSKYDQKVDIFAMGVVFFELCYWCRPTGYNVKKNEYYQKGIYSQELNNLIDRMIDENKETRIGSSEAFALAKKNFIKKYVKNSSIEAILFCFNNYPNFVEYFNNSNNILFLNDNKREIGLKVFNVIRSFSNTNEDAKDNINDALYELRKSIAKSGLNIKQDNIEIDPGIFLSFLMKKLNSELNQIMKIDQNVDFNDLIALSSSYTFLPGEEENNFRIFIDAYYKRLFSLISLNFCNVMKTKKQCLGCGKIVFSFSMFHFIPFNVDILFKKMQNNNNYLKLKNFFIYLCNDYKILDEKKKIYCNDCQKFTMFMESKKFYHTSKNLIIMFDRGQNYQNKQFINFDEDLILDRNDVERYEMVKYKLVGIIAKEENENNNGEYIAFTLKKYHNNQWISNKDKNDIISLEEVKKRGTILALFYYCLDENKTTDSNNIQNMNNVNNRMRNSMPQIMFHPNNTQFYNNNSGDIIINKANSGMINSMDNINNIGMNNNIIENNSMPFGTNIGIQNK